MHRATFLRLVSPLLRGRGATATKVNFRVAASDQMNGRPTAIDLLIDFIAFVC
jgi:hypothetical protein